MREPNYDIFFFNGDPQVDLLSSVFKDFKLYIKDKQVNIITVTEELENAPDLISYLNYGTEKYWWLVCEVNNITDPSTELVKGKKIAIPRFSDITSFLQNKNSKSNSSINSTVIL